MTKCTFLMENVMERTYLLFHSRFIRYTSRFALCPPGRYAQRKAIPRRNLIKTIKLWKETSAEPSRSSEEKERKDKKRENKSTRLEARIRFSSPTFIFARFSLNPPILFFYTYLQLYFYFSIYPFSILSVLQHTYRFS